DGPAPTADDIRTGLDGHVCRCGVQRRIVEAVLGAAGGAPPMPAHGARAVREIEASGGAPGDLLEADDRGYFEALGGGLGSRLPPPAGRSRWAAAWSTPGGAWLHVAADGRVTAFSGKVELGQGIRAGLAAIVADELRARFRDVRVVLSDTDVSPY